MSARVEVRTGVTVVVKARGPLILPLPSGNGPFTFIELAIPGGGYRRISVADNGQQLGAAGTGSNSLPYLDLTKPDATVARIMMRQDGGQGLGVGQTTGARPYLDFLTPGGSVWRMTVANSGQTQLTKQ